MLKDRNFLCCATITALGIIFCAIYFKYPVHDFGNYYFGSRFALQGINIRDIYEPFKFNMLIRNLPDLQGQPFLENYAVVPPFTLLFYIPFSFADIYLSKFLFNLVSVLAFSFFLFRLLKHLHVQSVLVLILPLVLIVPFRNNLLFGQTYLLLSGFLMAGFVAEEKKKNITAAACYALAIALKISPAILLCYLLARKNFKVFLLVILFSILFFLSAVYFTGWGFMRQYLVDYIPRMSANEINNPYATTYQSFTVLFRNLFIPDLLLHPSAPFDSPLAFSCFNGLCAGVLFFFFAKRLLKSNDHFSVFSFTLMSGCLFTAYTSSYSLIFLLPLCIQTISVKHAKIIPVLILVFLICTVPVNAFQSLPLLLRFPRLYLLLILFLITGDLMKPARRDLKWLSLSVTFFISVSIILSKRTDKSDYYLDHEIALLSYDFEFRGKELVVKFLDENGAGEKIIQLRDSIKTLEPLDLINNEIYFHNGLISASGHKRNPVLVNNKEIIYLGDQNRGIGFYALRKITLLGK